MRLKPPRRRPVASCAILFGREYHEKRPETLRAVAYHEAGHVAVADFFQVRSVEAAIEWDAATWTDGYVVHDGRQIRGLDFTSFAIICLAGREAQRKFNRLSWRGWHSEEDETDAYRSVRHLTRSEAGTEAYLRGLREFTERLLVRPPVWRVVEAVAAALLVERTLKGKELDQIIHRSRPASGIAELPRKTRVRW